MSFVLSFYDSCNQLKIVSVDKRIVVSIDSRQILIAFKIKDHMSQENKNRAQSVRFLELNRTYIQMDRYEIDIMNELSKNISTRKTQAHFFE